MNYLPPSSSWGGGGEIFHLLQKIVSGIKCKKYCQYQGLNLQLSLVDFIRTSVMQMTALNSLQHNFLKIFISLRNQFDRLIFANFQVCKILCSINRFNKGCSDFGPEFWKIRFQIPPGTKLKFGWCRGHLLGRDCSFLWRVCSSVSSSPSACLKENSSSSATSEEDVVTSMGVVCTSPRILRQIFSVTFNYIWERKSAAVLTEPAICAILKLNCST